jgi:hypothetical protein
VCDLRCDHDSDRTQIALLGAVAAADVEIDTLYGVAKDPLDIEGAWAMRSPH